MFLKKVRSISILMVLAMLFVSFSASARIAEGPARDIRVVYVKVAADKEYRDFYGTGWQDQIKNLIEKVSQAFKREFGIRFEVGEFEEWDSEIHKTIRGFLEELRREVKSEKNDLVIGFTGKGNFDEADACIWRFFGDYVMLEDFKASIQWWKKSYEAHKEFYKTQPGWETWEKWRKNLVEPSEKINLARILAHELGNIFGAFDVCDKQNPSVMNECLPPEDQTSELVFDEPNKKIILDNKDTDFKQIAHKREQAEKELEFVEKCETAIEMVFHLDKAAEIYEEIPTVWDMEDAFEARKYAAGILKALNQEGELKREYLGLAKLFIKLVQIFKQFHQVEGVNSTQLPVIARTYYEAAKCFNQAGNIRKAVEYGVKAAQVYEEIGGRESLSKAKALYEWAAQVFEELGEKEKAKEALEKVREIQKK